MYDMNGKIEKNEDQKKYEQNLKEMIMAETISAVDQEDLSKFRKFHSLLAELFSSLFSVAEVEDFDGSLSRHLLRQLEHAHARHHSATQ